MPASPPRDMDILPFDEPLTWDAETLTIASVTTVEATALVAAWHYSGGGAGNTINVGLYWGLRLVGVAAFGIPVSMDAASSVFGEEYADRVRDLGRFVLVDEAPTNTESWFLVRALRHLKALRPSTWAVTSFADSSEGHLGVIYQATNALYGGTTGTRVQYRDEHGRVRSDRMSGHKVTLSEARTRGWTPVRRGAKHRYLYLTPDDRKHRRQLDRSVLWTRHPYPKRDP